MQVINIQTVFSVYGPMRSWRFGRSLGIDPIGGVSTCSFNCVYCQLGEIQHQQCERQIFVPTQQIRHDLELFAPWDVDIITLSGSGEPTLAMNLGSILTMVKTLTKKPVGVLTNGSLLPDPTVRLALAIADRVSVKIDAVVADQFRRINRPLTNITDTELTQAWAGLQQFRHAYSGKLAIQTMLLSPWSELDQARYITLMQTLRPDEIHLNTPTRPKPTTRQIESRGNQPPTSPDLVQWLKPVDVEILKAFSDRIQTATHIPVRYPQPINH